MKTLAAFFLILICSCVSTATPKYVFTDGIFDLPHFGHQRLIQSAIKEAATVFNVPEDQIRLIAGVSGTPEEIANYKRPSVYTIEEKMAEVSGFKGVYKVVNSPMVTTRAFMDENHIDLVVAGSDYADLDKARKYYGDAIEMGKFRTVPRTEGISTSDIMRRTVQAVATVIRGKLTDAQKGEKATIDRFLILMKDKF